MISGDVDDGGLEQAFGAIADELDAMVEGVVFRAGARLRTQVRANASTGSHIPGDPHIPGTGPGPNVATGDYRGSITLETARDATGPVAHVTSNAPQAFRLEYGFNGTDSLGRSYRQPPYPHWRPAAEKVEETLDAATKRALNKLLRPLRE